VPRRHELLSADLKFLIRNSVRSGKRESRVQIPHRPKTCEHKQCYVLRLRILKRSSLFRCPGLQTVNQTFHEERTRQIQANPEVLGGTTDSLLPRLYSSGVWVSTSGCSVRLDAGRILQADVIQQLHPILLRRFAALLGLLSALVLLKIFCANACTVC
jgi:hypothetical protein